MTLGIIAWAIIHGGTLVETVSPYSEAKENLKGQTLNTFGPLTADSKAIERAWKSFCFIFVIDSDLELKSKTV